MAQPQPPIQSLIKPEQVAKLANFPEEQKGKYMTGITRLWEQINNRPPESPEYQAAYKKLIEVTRNIKKTMEARKEQMAAAGAASQNQNGARPPNQSGQQEARPPQQTQAQAGAAVSQQPGEQQPQYAQKLLEKVEQLKVLAPPQILATQGQEAASEWIKQMKLKYANAQNRLEQTETQLKKLNQMVNQRNNSGSPLSPEELEQFATQNNKLSTARDQALIWVKQFNQQQESIKVQMERTQNGSSEGDHAAPSTAQEAPTLTATASETAQKSNNTITGTDHPRKDSLSGRPGMNMPGQSQAPPLPPTSAPLNTQPAVPSSASTHLNNVPHPSNTKAESSAQENKFNPPQAPPIHPPHHAEPQPLKHEAAIERARTFSQTGYPQNPPPSAHGHPPQHNQREGQANSHTKMPVPKDLVIPPPQPVSMGQSRPTMTNGPLNMGPIGQPAIQRTPGYVLEGDGERVLSKKKLEELVKQVTGGSGIEGESGEMITPDVEETLLNVADEFVDQVIVSACRLAKLRQSSTLELRDIQLILERNYNIRVPGYASDELRTVKKIQPAPGWTQKLSAVQAAKVTGGKGDI